MASRRRGWTAALVAVGVWLAAAPVALAQSLIRDTEIEEIIRAQADPVFEASGLDPRDVRLLLVNDPSLNAFAAQGQIVGFHTGLILEADTPNELLGVIAHEAGHLSGGHTVSNGISRSGMRPFLLTMGLGVLAVLAGAPDAGAALVASSGYFGTLGALTYSRAQEAAADQAAVTALERAGRSAQGLVDFFDEFRYQEVFSQERRFPYFRSHPLSSERISALRRRVQDQRHHGVEDTPEELLAHRTMQAKIYAFLNAPAYTYRRYPESDASYPARYARAIAHYRATETEAALTAIDALIEEQPENPYLWELRGQVLFEVGQPAEAEPAHRRAVELKPDAPLLRINLAQALIAQEDETKRDEAIAELERALSHERDNAVAWWLMAQAHGARDDQGPARLAIAEYHFHIGDMAEARRSAVFARAALERGSTSWRRAVDIILATGATPEDLEALDRANARADIN